MITTAVLEPVLETTPISTIPVSHGKWIAQKKCSQGLNFVIVHCTHNQAYCVTSGDFSSNTHLCAKNAFAAQNNLVCVSMELTGH